MSTPFEIRILARISKYGSEPEPFFTRCRSPGTAGNGALANGALDRALADDPAYQMAGLLRQAIDSRAPPAMARPPMTPEEVAAYCDDATAQHHGNSPSSTSR
jgi:hypothetical protein